MHGHCIHIWLFTAACHWKGSYCSISKAEINFQNLSSGYLIFYICSLQYPVHLSEDNKGTAKDSLHRSFTGLQSVDEICCAHGLSNQQFEDQVEREPNVVLIWK
jgi:hypothetical protein